MSTRSNSATMDKILDVLLIEDDTIEVMKMKRVIETLNMKHHLRLAENGEIALALLEKNEIRPGIILLDLNMPKVNGIEFLSTIKNNNSLKHIPCIILSTSNNPRDLRACYELGVAGYVIKPLKYEDYVRKIESLLNYWSNNELIDSL